MIPPRADNSVAALRGGNRRCDTPPLLFYTYISLNHGMVAKVDADDYEIVRGFKWRYMKPHNCKSGYAIASTSSSAGVKYILMHRLICGLSHGDGKLVDHVDSDGLNNTRSNLRVCSHAENARNRKINNNSSTGFKGVRKHRGRYRADISLNGRKIALGHFDTPEDAHAAYCAAAAKLHGEFARAA